MNQLNFPLILGISSLLGIILLFSCKGTRNTSAPAANFELESETGWTWIQRPPIPEGGKDYRLLFEPEERYTLYLDVNSCFGQYRKEPDMALSLPKFAACTEMCCDKETARAFLASFHSMKSYDIHGDTLILRGGGNTMYFLSSSVVQKGE